MRTVKRKYKATIYKEIELEIPDFVHSPSNHYINTLAEQALDKSINEDSPLKGDFTCFIEDGIEDVLLKAVVKSRGVNWEVVNVE